MKNKTNICLFESKSDDTVCGESRFVNKMTCEVLTNFYSAQNSFDKICDEHSH